MSHYDECTCAWCNRDTDVEGSYEIAVCDEDGNEVGYELACRLCFDYLLSLRLEIA